MIDFQDPAFVLDPYPKLKELRQEGKPVWHEGLGMWLAARHTDANAVLRTKTLGRIFTPKTPESQWGEFNWLHADSILDSEPPKHTRLRSLVGKAFSRSRIEALKPEIERIANLLLDDAQVKLDATGSFDLIADYAEPLPVKVIAALLGFPDQDEHLLRPWSQAIVKMYEVNPSLEAQAEAKQAAHEFAIKILSETMNAVRIDEKLDDTKLQALINNENRKISRKPRLFFIKKDKIKNIKI
jgi:cytochrome P450